MSDSLPRALNFLTSSSAYADYRPAICPSSDVVIFERARVGGGLTTLYKIADLTAPDEAEQRIAIRPERVVVWRACPRHPFVRDGRSMLAVDLRTRDGFTHAASRSASLNPRSPRAVPS